MLSFYTIHVKVDFKYIVSMITSADGLTLRLTGTKIKQQVNTRSYNNSVTVAVEVTIVGVI